MSWNIAIQDEFERGILSDCVDEVVDNAKDYLEENPDADAYEAVDYGIRDVLDSRFVYYEDQLAAIVYYGHVSDGMDATWEDLEGDIYGRATDILEEDMEEDEEDYEEGPVTV